MFGVKRQQKEAEGRLRHQALRSTLGRLRLARLVRSSDSAPSRGETVARASTRVTSGMTGEDKPPRWRARLHACLSVRGCLTHVFFQI